MSTSSLKTIAQGVELNADDPHVKTLANLFAQLCDIVEENEQAAESRLRNLADTVSGEPFQEIPN